MYDAKNVMQGNKGLPADGIFRGIIMKIEDGTVRQFIKSEEALSNWKGNVDGSAINVHYEVRADEKSQPVMIDEMFTYISENGKTMYGKNSNLEKYIKKYGKAPEVGDQVKVATDGSGYAKIKKD